MRKGDFVEYIARRARHDNLIAFVCRLIRFAVVAIFSVGYRAKYSNVEHPSIIKVVGIKMKLPESNNGILRDLLLNGCREPYVSRAYTNLINEGDVVFELGANIGYYALQAANLVGKTGLVYAIEPVPQNVQALRENIELNGFSNIEVYEIAIGERDEKSKIMISEKGNLCTMESVNAHRTFISSTEIETMSLDSFVKGRRVPDFLRMDVEGYEYNIIKGMPELLRLGHPRRMFIEVHFDILREKAMEMLKTLKESGYEIIVATVEPHPAVQNSPLGIRATTLLDKFIGVGQGYINVSIDDILSNPIFERGQVEWMEIIFERKNNG